MRILLFVLILSLYGELCGQRDMVYRRGMTVSISYDFEQEKTSKYQLYLPEDKRDISNPPSPVYNATLINGGDTITYYPLAAPLLVANKPGSASSRYNVQLRLEKKLRSGFEFGGGLYYSKGWYDTAPNTPATDLTDYAYYARRIDYLTYGLTGQLEFDFFRNHRLQPSIGLQSLFLNHRTRGSNQRAVFPTYGAEVSTNPDNPAGRSAPANSFILDLRIMAALTYPLTERIIVVANVYLLSAAKHAVGGVQLKYRFTDY